MATGGTGVACLELVAIALTRPFENFCVILEGDLAAHRLSALATVPWWALNETPTWLGPVKLGSSPGGIQLYSDRMSGQYKTSVRLTVPE
ncbi:MAG TPA: hypothetical protein VMF65_16575 [Acidimicrobiales bacterium]|nr:hypothetical protein [Acidimicrobiales bacterium]